MKFGPVPVNQAEGKILAHNINKGQSYRPIRKGKHLNPGDITMLLEAGYQTVYVAELETGDLDENSAALQIAKAILDKADAESMLIKGPSHGRTSLVARTGGVLRVDSDRLNQLNSCEGVTIATLQTHSIVNAGETVTSIKIIPYAIPSGVMEQALNITRDGFHPLLELCRFTIKRIGLIYASTLNARERIIKSYETPLRRRAESYEARIALSDFACVSGKNDEYEMADVLLRQAGQGAEIIIIAGETSTMDRNDIIPHAVQRAGGEVICVGAPIEPGNLLTLAYLGEIPVLGVPGCIRSPKPTQIDQILASLLAGERLQRIDITMLGHGGLWERATHGT